jgi:hypothetical protein
MKVALLVMTIIFGVGGCGWLTARCINEVIFDRGCEGYLKRAADANTVEMAHDQLAIAVKYAKDNNLTTGYTSILYNTPDEDVGFWYGNISKSLTELESITKKSTLLERSNMLIKLRETLLDDKKDGVTVTVPSGIYLYPHNGVYAMWGCVMWILCLLSGIVLFVKVNEY